MSGNQNGLFTSRDVAGSGDPNSVFFIRNEDPVVINNLIANAITADQINLNGGVVSTAEDGTVLTLNGVPVGSEGVISVTGEAPIAVSVGQNPVVSLTDSTVVPGTYSFAQITVDSKGIITDASNGVIPSNEDWSNFPAQTDVDLNGHQIDNVTKIVGDTSLILSAATDIVVDPLFGTFRTTSKSIRILAIAPQGQEVSDSTLEIETDNDMSITATDALAITAGTMTINNAVDMTAHKLTNVATPTDATDAATKSYVDGLDAQDVKLTGDQSISGVKTFTTLPETSVGPTLPSQFVNKAYVDAITPPTPGLGTVLNVSNVASKDIDMDGYDIANVNDITMNGLVPTITGTNIAGNMVIAAANTMNITTAGQMTLAAGGVMSIGGATYTTLENLNIDNSVIKKETGTDDLTIRDVGAIYMGGSGAINFVDEATITGTGLKILSIADAGVSPYPTVLGYDAGSGNVKYQPATATPGLSEVLAVSNMTGGTTIDSSTGIVLTNELDVATIKALGFPANTDVGMEANLVFPNDASIRFQGLGYITSAQALTLNAGSDEDVVRITSYAEAARGISLGDALEVSNGAGQPGYVLQTNGFGSAPTWVDVGTIGTVVSVNSGTNITVDNAIPTAPVVNLDMKENLDMKTKAITNASSLGFSATQSIGQSGTSIVYDVPSNGTHIFKIAGTTGVVISGNITLPTSGYVATQIVRPSNDSNRLQITGGRPTASAVPVQITAAAGLALGNFLTNIGTPGQVLTSGGAGNPTWTTLPAAGGQVNTVVQGSNIAVDSTDPVNPIVSVAVSSTLDMNNQSLTEVKDVTLNNGATIENAATNNLTLKAAPTAINSLVLTDTQTLANRVKVQSALQTDSIFSYSNNGSDTVKVYNAPFALEKTLKVGPSEDPGLAGQVLSSTGNGLAWTTIAAGGVQSVTGIGNIDVDNTDPAAPVVSFDVIEDILMNGSNITNANITETNQLHGVDGQALVLRSYNQDIQLEAGTAGGFNINLVDAVKCGTSLELGNVSNAVPLLLQGDAGTNGQYLKSMGTGATPQWADIPATPTPSLAEVVAVDNTAGGNIVMTGYSILDAVAIETNQVNGGVGQSLTLNSDNDIVLNPIGASAAVTATKLITAQNGISLNGPNAPLIASADAPQPEGNLGQYLVSQGAGATPKWMDLVAPPQGLYVNTLYANDNVVDIQTVVDSATQGDAIMIGAGSYGGATLTINGKQNIALIAPYRANGQTITELAARGLTIAPDCTGSISINNLQIEGLLTLGGTGNYYIQNVQALGGITITAGTMGNFFFQNCEVQGLITVPNTFGGAIVFGQCNMTGATYSLNNVSPLQVQIALCTGLPTSRPINATYGSTNSDTALTITTDTNILKVGGSAGTATQVLTSQGPGLPTIWADATGGGGGITSVSGSTYIDAITTGTDVVVSSKYSLTENAALPCLINNSSTVNPSAYGTVLGNSEDDIDGWPYLKTFANQVPSSAQNTVFGPFTMCAPPVQTTANTFNVAMGNLALTPNQPTADYPVQRNIAIGQQALGLCTGTGLADNVAIGVAAGYLANCNRSTFIGRNAGRGMAQKDDCLCIGYETGNGLNQAATTAIGPYSGRSCTAGVNNTFIGTDVGFVCQGSTNTVLGSRSFYRVNGSNNIVIGTDLQKNATTTVLNNTFQVGTAVSPTYLSGTMNATPTLNTLAMQGTASFGDVALTNATLSGTAGGNSGQHLRLIINGVPYKISLLADV